MHGSKCEKQLVILKLPHINSLYKAVRQRANVYKEIHISKRVYHLIILLKDYYIIIFFPVLRVEPECCDVLGIHL